MCKNENWERSVCYYLMTGNAFPLGKLVSNEISVQLLRLGSVLIVL